MRPIKFRLLDKGKIVGYERWNGLEEKWCYDTKPDGWFSIKNPFISHTDKDEYTGKEDKNDKEIYEGDEVDWYYDELGSGGEGITRHEYKKCEVFWHPEFAGLMLRTKDDFGAWHFYEDMAIEIIGNIHEAG